MKVHCTFTFLLELSTYLDRKPNLNELLPELLNEVVQQEAKMSINSIIQASVLKRKMNEGMEVTHLITKLYN